MSLFRPSPEFKELLASVQADLDAKDAAAQPPPKRAKHTPNTPDTSVLITKHPKVANFIDKKQKDEAKLQRLAKQGTENLKLVRRILTELDYHCVHTLDKKLYRMYPTVSDIADPKGYEVILQGMYMHPVISLRFQQLPKDKSTKSLKAFFAELLTACNKALPASLSQWRLRDVRVLRCAPLKRVYVILRRHRIRFSQQLQCFLKKAGYDSSVPSVFYVPLVDNVDTRRIMGTADVGVTCDDPDQQSIYYSELS